MNYQDNLSAVMLTAQDLNNLLSQFVDYLLSSGASRATIKNYSSDLSKVFATINSSEPVTSADLYSSLDMLKESFSEATVRRFSYSLKSFISWAKSQGYNLEVINQVVSHVETKKSPVESYLAKLHDQGAPKATVENYTKDLSRFLFWVKPTAKTLADVDSKTVNRVSTLDIKRFINYLKSKGFSEASINRYLFSLKDFFKYNKKEIVFDNNPVKPSFLNQNLTKESRWKRLLKYRPFWWHAYRGHPISDYLNWAALAVITLFIGIGLYQNLYPQKIAQVAQNNSGIVLGSAAPPRILSFQGRLTNASGAPIVVATNVVFKIYDARTVGTLKWTSKTWSVTPDSNGIFSVCLGGQDTTDDCLLNGVADTVIPANLFTDNPSLYLGITVGSDPEATPRQRIASSTYALNAGALNSSFASATNNDFGNSISITNANTSVSSVTVNGLAITPNGTLNPNGGANNIENVLLFNTPLTANSNVFYGLNFGTGYTDILRYNSTQLISGTGVTGSGLTIALGTSLFTGTLANSKGGTGQDSSAWTGVPSVSSGTWSINSVLPISLGGTNGSATPTNGAVAYGTGSAYAFTLGPSGAGSCLLSGSGSPATPTWGNCASGSGTAVLLAPSGAQSDATTNSSINISKTGVASLLNLSQTSAVTSTYSTTDLSITRGITSATASINSAGNILNLVNSSNFSGAGATNVPTEILVTNPTPTGGALFTGNYIDLQRADSAGGSQVSKFSIDATGNITAAGNYNSNTFTSSSLAFGSSAAGSDFISGLANTNLQIRTVTSGTLTLNSAGALNFNGAATSTWNLGSNTLTLTSSNFNVSSAGVVTLAGAQAADITTSAGTAPTALVFQPGNNTTATSTGANFTLQAGNDSGATSATGGLLTLKGGNATGGSQTGGGVTIDSGSGTAGGAISIGATNAASLALGRASATFALTSSGGLNVTTGGALTGVASLDTIATSATALTFAGAGTISATGANALTLQGGASGALTLTGNAASTWSTSSGSLGITGATTLTLNSTGANAITLDSTTTGQVNIGTSNNAKAIVLGNATPATTFSFSSGAATGNVFALADNSLTIGTLLNLSSTSATQSSANLISANHTATYTTTVNDTGNFLNLTRNLSTNTGGALTISGALASLSSNCTVTAGTCADAANLLALVQSYSASTGTVIYVSNTGSGAALGITPGNLVGTLQSQIKINGTVTGTGVVSYNSISDSTTINHTTDPGAFGADFLFRSTNTELINTAADNSAGLIPFASQPVLQVSGANLGTRTQSAHIGFYSGATTSNTGSGTTALTITTLAGFKAAATTIGASTTVSNLYGFYASNTAPTGTLTNQYGLYIENLTGAATSNYGIYVAGASTAGINLSSINLGSTGLLGTLAGSNTGNTTGVGITTGTITSGTQNAFLATLTPTTAGTVNGFNIGYAGGTFGVSAAVNGLNIQAITATSGNKNAINIGTGWDFGVTLPLAGTAALNLSDASFAAAGGIRFNTGDVQLFRSGANTLSLGAATTLTAAGALSINAGGINVLTLNNGGSGNIQFFSSSNSITSAGAFTIAGNMTVNGGSLFLGVDNTTNGSIKLYSSGVGITDPTIAADATGSLILTGAAGDLTIGQSGTATNLKFLESSYISASTTKSINLGDGTNVVTFNFDRNNTTYNFKNILTNGATALTIDNGTSGTISIGNNSYAKSIVFGNSTPSDNFAFSTGATNNTSTFALYENALSSGTGIYQSLNSLSTGVGFFMDATNSSVLTSGKFLDIEMNTAVGSFYSGSNTISGNLGKFSEELYQGAIGTSNRTGSVLDISRLYTSDGSGTMNVSGAVVSIYSNPYILQNSPGSVTENILSLSEGMTFASGNVLQIANSGTGAWIGMTTSGSATNDSASMKIGNSSTASQNNRSILNLQNGGTGYFDLELVRGFVNNQGTNSFDDEFTGRQLDTTNMWQTPAATGTATCSSTFTVGIVNGVLRQTTGATNPGACTLSTQATLSNGFYQRGNNPVFETSVKMGTGGAGVRAFFGFTNTAVASGSDTLPASTHAAMIEKRAADTDWWCVTMDGTTESRTDTGVAVSISAFQRLRVEVQNGATPQVKCSVDSTTINKTTNIPGQTSAMDIYLKTETSDTTTENNDIDYVRAWQDDPPATITPPANQTTTAGTNSPVIDPISQADIAENYQAADGTTAEPGDLVSTSSGQKVALSSGTYDQKLLGIVSTSPYQTIGSDNFTGVVRVALNGRGPTKVSTENGPIAVGDPLTSSSVPGVAMKATQGGLIVGTALESYSDTAQTGKILVFVHTGYYPGSIEYQNAHANPSQFLTLDSGNNLTATISAGASFIWKNSLGQAVAWVTNTGEALFTKVTALVGDFQQLIFGELVAKKSAQIAGQVSFNSTDTEVTIASTKVKADSLINLTPISKTGGFKLYIKEIKPGESFTVGLERDGGDQPNQATASATSALQFNWFIINQQ